MLLFVGDSNLDQYVTEPEKFSTLIGAGLGLPVVTAGVSGNTAAQMLERIPGLKAQHAPTHVFVMAGTNDMAGNPHPMDVVLPAYLSTMAQIIDAIRPDAVPVIFTPPAIEEPRECLRYPELIDGLIRLCKAKRCLWFDVYGTMVQDARDMGPAVWLEWYRPEPADLYHLSATGHARLADAFLRAQIIPASVPVPPGEPETVFDQVLDTHFGNISGKTIKVFVTPSAPSFTPRFLRATLQGHAEESLVLQKLLIRGQSLGAVTVPMGGTLVTPWLPLTWTPGSAIEFSVYSNAAPSEDRMAARTGFNTTWLRNGDFAAQTGTAGFTPVTSYHSLVAKLEMAP